MKRGARKDPIPILWFAAEEFSETSLARRAIGCIVSAFLLPGLLWVLYMGVVIPV